jgi:hypothetical protein
MVVFQEITIEQAKECMQNQEFDPEIIGSKEKVAVILTQSWCPQWAALRPELEKLKNNSIDIWLFIYDLSDIFESFKDFKENLLGNDEIPYIRYYRNGEYLRDSNYVDVKEFVKKFEK